MKCQREAETLYALLREGRMSFKSFLHNALCLEKADYDAALYLLFLLNYGQDNPVRAWPRLRLLVRISPYL